MSDFESLLGWDIDVGRHAGAFPVRLAVWIDSAPARDPHAEMSIDPTASARMRASARCLTNNRRSLQVLQVVSEFFSRRERPFGRQHVNLLLVTIASSW